MTLRRTLTALLALVWTGGFGGLPQAVLCVGAGHVAVEVLKGNDCHPASVDGLALCDHCPEGCEDTPLGSGPGIRTTDDRDGIDEAPTPFVARLPVPDEPSALPGRLATSLSATDPTAPRTGTTVLLC